MLFVVLIIVALVIVFWQVGLFNRLDRQSGFDFSSNDATPITMSCNVKA